MRLNKYSIVFFLFYCSFSCSSKAKDNIVKPISDSTFMKYSSKIKKGFTYYHIDKYTTSAYPQTLPYKTDSNNVTITDDDSLFLIFDIKTLKPYLLRQGDSILIERSVNDSLLLSNIGNPTRNPELLFFTQMPVEIEYKVYKMNTMNKQLTIQSIYSMRLEYLKSAQKKYSLSPDFITYCNNLFYYDLITDSIQLNKSKNNISINEYKAIVENINKKGDTGNYAFRAASWNLLEYLSLKELKIFNYKNAISIIENYTSGSVKNYLTYRVLDFFMNKNPEEIKIELSKFNKALNTEKYTAILNENIKIYAGWQQLSSSYDSLICYDYYNSKISLKQIIEKNKTKVVFMDFWATWCGPCIADIPLSVALADKYDCSSFKRVFISVDQKVVGWKKFIIENNMPITDCFIFSQTSMPSFQKIFMTKTVPHYALFKNGKLLMNNTYSPHDKSLIDLLNKSIR